MTGVALRERPAPAEVRLPPAGPSGPPPAVPRRESRIGPIAVETALFAALGLLGTLLWSRLVADPPLGRLLAALALTAGGGAAIAWLGGRLRRRGRARLAALGVGVAATAAACVTVGLPARLLLLPNWPELLDSLSLGLAGIEDSEMPYDGGDPWVRLTLLLGVPLLLGAAATIGFWPGRRRRALRVAALVPMLVLYGFAVTLDSPGAELLWGVALCVCVCAWVWAPGLARRRAAVGLAVAAAAALLAIPAAGRLDPGAPWWDYESWNWFGREREVSFEWNHTYGPLEWPREGTTLLEVESDQPLYWKASVLDRFDGFTWQRARGDDELAADERLARDDTVRPALADRHEEWLTEASFRVGALSSGLAIGAGTPEADSVSGLDGFELSADGTVALSEPLAAGDEYSLLAYSPRPTAAELRAAPDRYPGRRFSGSTLIGLPATVAPIFEPAPPGAGDPDGFEGGFAPARPRRMPLWGEPADPEADAALLASPYAGVLRRARRLTAGAATPYAAVRAIQSHLRDGYDYTPNVPQHTYPLTSFLFEDRAGYCQQFAGAMTLMLRMVGIPSRVVSGFAPGSFDGERGVYEVRDTDAHSWVEVYFRGIGWVTFDPTPAAAPAASQALNVSAGTLRGAEGDPEQPFGRARSIERASEGGIVGPIRDAGGPWGAVGLGALALAALAGLAASLVIWRRRRILAAGRALDAQLAELGRALPRLGWRLAPGATLLGLERRFRAAGRAPIAAYVSGLRASRYGGAAPPPPGPAARRALRRALGAGGLRRRLRALAAIPPGGPG